MLDLERVVRENSPFFFVLLRSFVRGCVIVWLKRLSAAVGKKC